MSKKIVIGIDLGTSTSEICMFRENGEPIPIPDPITKTPIVPSIIAIDNKERILVGDLARAYVDIKERGIREVKRKMGTDEKIKIGSQIYRPEEISAIILKYLKEFAENHIGEKIEDVVLTVPANFNDSERKATRTAASIAGLKVTRLINEPTAAALAYGILDINAQGQVIVIDFGGGTLDITVLEMMEGILDVKSTFGDTHLGGKDIDDILCELILAKFNKKFSKAIISSKAQEKLKSEAERVKIALSQKESIDVEILGFAAFEGKSIDLNLSISRNEFEIAMKPIIEKTTECINKALNAKNTSINSIEKILLVGGTSYIPCVRKLVKKFFNKDTIHGINPDLAIALGAATQAAITKDIVKNQMLIVADVCSYGFGIDCVKIIGQQPMLTYDELIPPNTTIPYTVSRDYNLLSPDQREVKISLYQDHEGKARLPEECKNMATGIISDIPPSLYGSPHPLKVNFSYNIDGEIIVEANIPGLNRSCKIMFQPFKTGMNEDEIIKGTARIKGTTIESVHFSRYVSLIEKAEEVLLTVSGINKVEIENLLKKMKNEINNNNSSLAKKISEELTDLLYDLEN